MVVLVGFLFCLVGFVVFLFWFGLVFLSFFFCLFVFFLGGGRGVASTGNVHLLRQFYVVQH